MNTYRYSAPTCSGRPIPDADAIMDQLADHAIEQNTIEKAMLRLCKKGVNPKYEDPYPLSDKYFLCSRMTGQGEQMGIYLLDTFGNEILLHAEGQGCFDPMPMGKRPRPMVVPPRRDFENGTGYFFVIRKSDPVACYMYEVFTVPHIMN